MVALSDPALLVLEDGTIFRGQAWGARGQTFGEIVFTTGLTGYQETLTDPSYHRQIVVMTAPHVGNTGMNDEDPESSQIWVSGFVVRDPARRPSSWRATDSLEHRLIDDGVVGISQIDTRQVTRHIRSIGSMKAGIFSGAELVVTGTDAGSDTTPILNTAELIDRVRSQPSIHEAALTTEVSTALPYTVEPSGEVLADVVALDLGIKDMTPRRLAERGLRVHVLPARSSLKEILDCHPDGVFFSNGPGDPQTATEEIALLQEILRLKLPYFGICFGNQLLGRALGFDTYKLDFGHRGINQPVKDLRTGKVEITAHNHGFAVEAPPNQELSTPFGRVRVSHLGLNDSVVEGLECLDIPAFSVQYHPEAAAGPHDASYLFDDFVTMILAAKENHHA